MHTISFKAPEKLHSRLLQMADRLERDKSYLIRKAIEQFIEEEEDYLLALERLKEDRPGRRISLSEIERRYGQTIGSKTARSIPKKR